ncbi:MAG TPA: hypothetical protein VG917_00020 [Patescibacteria group bacterium]|nr:hypothetical protein [Patescibacteria group bacterium]
MKKYFYYTPHVLLFFLVVIVFKTWFLPGIITGGDFWFNFPSMYSQFDMFAFAWNWAKGNGLGIFSPLYQAINLVFGAPIFTFGSLLKLPWEIVERLGFFYPFIILGLLAPSYLFKKIFKNNPLWIFSIIIFLFNTYILTLAGGGQIVIAISYTLIPFIIAACIKLAEDTGSPVRKSNILGALAGTQILLDLRIGYITFVAIGIFYLLQLFTRKKALKDAFRNFTYLLLIPGLITLLINAFWIFPVVVVHENPLNELGSAFNTVGAVKFFSFAKFENSLGLLHPNWPENIFGKVAFMKWEFLILPFFAFASLLFVNKKRRESIYIIYFVLLAIVGIFLAKGANDPFGSIYLLLFNYLPGFTLFRDPTKWYMLIAVSYSVLIPFSLYEIYELIKKEKRLRSLATLKINSIFVALFFVYLIYLIRPAILGQLGGTYRKHTLPADYVKLEKFLSTQDDFSRTLWIPTMQRFSYYSQNHPSVAAQDLFNVFSEKQIIKAIAKPSSQDRLKILGIKYVIVPYDTEGEIFLSDRKYDEKGYLKTISDLEKIKYLHRVDGFGHIAVFRADNVYPHFWSNNNLQIKEKYIHPTKYFLEVKNAKKGDVVIFSESFDKKWIAQIDGQKIISKDYEGLNSFVLNKDGNYNFLITYKAQIYVVLGLWISTVTVLFLLFFLFVKKDEKK